MKLGRLIKTFTNWTICREKTELEKRFNFPVTATAEKGEETEVYLDIRVSERKYIKVPFDTDWVSSSNGEVTISIDIREEVKERINQKRS